MVSKFSPLFNTDVAALKALKMLAESTKRQEENIPILKEKKKLFYKSGSLTSL